MSLQFYTGGAGSGKTHRLLTHMIGESMADPRGYYLILVPEQSTMQTQKELVRLHPCHAIMNLEVLSFNRLAYRVFSEVGYRKNELLEEIGKTFLLEKIALEQKDHLAYFGRTLARPENIAAMKSILSELMLYGDSPEDLIQILGNPAGKAASAEEDSREAETAGNPVKGDAFHLKTQDVLLVYREFKEKMAGLYMTAEEVPDKLCELADRSGKLRGAHIALDGFTGFTPIQMKLVGKLMTVAAELAVTLTLDPDEYPGKNRSSRSLFALSHETAGALKDLARENGTEILPPVVVQSGSSSSFANSKDMAFLESHFLRSVAKYPEVPEAIHVGAFRSPRQEVKETARMIHRLIREKGYRYRDFAVITGDLPTYSNYVRQTFDAWGLPCFIDEKRSFLENPFIEYLRGALEACTDNYSYQSMFRWLKTGVAGFDRRAVEHLENYALGTGLAGKKKWRTPLARTYKDEDEAELPKLEQLRQEICALLDPMADVFARRRSTVKEKTKALWEFCVRSHAQEKIDIRQRELEAAGRGDLAREYAQVYPYVIHFLDKLVEVLGDEPISMEDYRALVEAGFSEGRVAIIPPGADRILVGDMERSRIGDVRVVFFLGVNDGLIPKTAASDGIFSDTDREKLRAGGIELKPTSREAMERERFYLYLALTKASEEMYLSFSTASASGEAIRPAYLIDVLRRMFPCLKVETAYEKLYDQVENEATDLSLLTGGLQELHRREPGRDFLELFSRYLHNPAYADRTRIILAAAAVTKPEDQIGRAAARALYGTNLRNSASRLEEFCACQFRHFLEYGLKLKDRPVYEFSGMDRGSVVHKALELYEKDLRQSEENWAEAAKDRDLRQESAAIMVNEAVRSSSGAILFDGERNRYEVQRMTRVIDRAIENLGEQLAAGDFKVAGTEEAFTNREDLHAVNVTLPDGSTMMLTGRIDRVDTCDLPDGRTLVKIIDYKTGNVQFDLTQVYHGLQLQLVLYLREAMEMLEEEGRHPVPAGIFYYHVDDPVVTLKPDSTKEDLENERGKKLKPSGVVLNDKMALKAFDHALAESGKSRYVPVEYKKDGELSSRSRTLSADEFYLLMDYVSRKIREIAEQIMRGDAKINPYRYNRKESACTYCPFHGICRFDRSVPGYTYREISGESQKNILKKMKDGEDDEVDGGTKKSH